MLTPPKVPWRYRLAALGIALAIGAGTLQVYEFGAKFANAVANYTRMAAKEAAAQQRHKPAAPDMKNEPGVVPVSIIPTRQEDKKPD